MNLPYDLCVRFTFSTSSVKDDRLRMTKCCTYSIQIHFDCNFFVVANVAPIVDTDLSQAALLL